MSKLEELLKQITPEDIKRICAELEWKDRVTDKWLEKYHSLPFEKRVELYQKVKSKYESDEYKDYWYSRGYEPSQYWYSFGFEYAKKYGTELDIDEDFLSGCYMVDGYMVKLYVGQGCFYHIEKI